MPKPSIYEVWESETQNIMSFEPDHRCLDRYRIFIELVVLIIDIMFYLHSVIMSEIEYLVMPC